MLSIIIYTIISVAFLAGEEYTQTCLSLTVIQGKQHHKYGVN